MPTLLILAILIALLVIVLMQLFKKSAPSPSAAPGPDLANLKVTDARVGDILSISGAGDALSDLDFTVDRSTRFDVGARRSLLLSGVYHERRVTLNVGTDEDVEVSLENSPSKLTIEDLGLAEEDLAQMDERQNTADSFEYDGQVWLYRRSREVKAWRDDQTQPTGFYYWEFQEQNGKRLLAFRKAEAEPFVVALYTAIPASDVTVYRGKP